jgi:DNA-binding IclR family transcriptional regulator
MRDCGRRHDRVEGGAVSLEIAPAGTQTLMRGLCVVDAVARGASDLRQISALTGTNRSTTHRLVVCLVQAGYLRAWPRRGYGLGPRLIELGFRAREEIPLATLARPHLERLAQATGDTVHLGVRDGDEVLYLDKVPGTKALEMRSRIGDRMSLANTGMGKALLLDLEESEWRRRHRGPGAQRRRARRAAGALAWPAFRDAMRRYAAGGYACDLEENEVAIRCIAAPVRDVEARIVAAISVSSTVPYMPVRRMRELVPVIQHVAADISAELGWQPPVTRPSKRE